MKQAIGKDRDFHKVPSAISKQFEWWSVSWWIPDLFLTTLKTKDTRPILGMIILCLTSLMTWHDGLSCGKCRGLMLTVKGYNVDKTEGVLLHTQRIMSSSELPIFPRRNCHNFYSRSQDESNKWLIIDIKAKAIPNVVKRDPGCIYGFLSRFHGWQHGLDGERRCHYPNPHRCHYPNPQRVSSVYRSLYAD